MMVRLLALEGMTIEGRYIAPGDEICLDTGLIEAARRRGELQSAVEDVRRAGARSYRKHEFLKTRDNTR